ncbi:hypothetical protein MSIBF_A3920001 [groundwater metagenome]|uniref:Uncharacterized protein n=1 Tax=groundwater metagenome TaxID=717931 RepID=A0A098ED44_9ZZZZ
MKNYTGILRFLQKVIPTINSLWHVNNQKKAMEILDKVQSILGSANKKINQKTC